VRRIMFIAVLAVALGSCAAPARDVALAGLDLNDRATLARLQYGLSQEDSGTLALYALRHWPGSRAYCGEPVVDAAGRLPRTVLEAIALTKARERFVAEAALARAAAPSPGEQLLRQRDDVTRRREMILARYQIALLQEKSGNPSPQVAELAVELKKLNDELTAIRLKLAEAGAAAKPLKNI
jgi:hypothetical protein